MPKKPKPPQKNRKWEKDRRDRLKEKFMSLAKVLPCYDPAIELCNEFVLENARTTIEDLQEELNKVLSQSAENIRNAKDEKFRKLQEKVKKLLSQNEQLCSLLKQAGISLPKYFGNGKLRKPLPWSNRFSPEKVKIIQKIEKGKENIVELAPNKKKVLGKIDNALSRKSGRVKRSPKKCDNKTKNMTPNSGCLIVMPQSNIVTSGCYVVPNQDLNPVRKIGSAKQSTKAGAKSIPYVNVNQPLPTLGPGTLLFANGTIMPVISQPQVIIPSPNPVIAVPKIVPAFNTIPKLFTNTSIDSNILCQPQIMQTSVLKNVPNMIVSIPKISMTTPKSITISTLSNVLVSSAKPIPALQEVPKSVANQSTKIVSKSATMLSVATSKNVSAIAVGTSSFQEKIAGNLRKLQTVAPKCLTKTTQINKVPIPALTSKYADSYLLLNSTQRKNDLVKAKKTIRKCVPRKGQKRKAEIHQEPVASKKPTVDVNSELEQVETNSEKAPEPTEEYGPKINLGPSGDKSPLSFPEKDKISPSDGDKILLADVSESVPAKTVSADDVLKQTNESNPENYSDEPPVDIVTTSASTGTTTVTHEEIKHLDLNLVHSDLSIDIFASLQVPPGCQNTDSTSPTAASRKLAFPLVSSLKPNDAAEDNSVSQRGTPNLLQIGNMDMTKTSHSDSLLNLDNFTFFSSKSVCGDYYNPFNVSTDKNDACNMAKTIKDRQVAVTDHLKHTSAAENIASGSEKSATNAKASNTSYSTQIKENKWEQSDFLDKQSKGAQQNAAIKSTTHATKVSEDTTIVQLNTPNNAPEPSETKNLHTCRMFGECDKDTHSEKNKKESQRPKEEESDSEAYSNKDLSCKILSKVSDVRKNFEMSENRGSSRNCKPNIVLNEKNQNSHSWSVNLQNVTPQTSQENPTNTNKENPCMLPESKETNTVHDVELISNNRAYQVSGNSVPTQPPVVWSEQKDFTNSETRSDENHCSKLADTSDSQKQIWPLNALQNIEGGTGDKSAHQIIRNVDNSTNQNSIWNSEKTFNMCDKRHNSAEGVWTGNSQYISSVMSSELAYQPDKNIIDTVTEKSTPQKRNHETQSVNIWKSQKDPTKCEKHDSNSVNTTPQSTKETHQARVWPINPAREIKTKIPEEPTYEIARHIDNMLTHNVWNSQEKHGTAISENCGKPVIETGENTKDASKHRQVWSENPSHNVKDVTALASTTQNWNIQKDTDKYDKLSNNAKYSKHETEAPQLTKDFNSQSQIWPTNSSQTVKSVSDEPMYQVTKHTDNLGTQNINAWNIQKAPNKCEKHNVKVVEYTSQQNLQNTPTTAETDIHNSRKNIPMWSSDVNNHEKQNSAIHYKNQNTFNSLNNSQTIQNSGMTNRNKNSQKELQNFDKQLGDSRMCSSHFNMYQETLDGSKVTHNLSNSNLKQNPNFWPTHNQYNTFDVAKNVPYKPSNQYTQKANSHYNQFISASKESAPNVNYNSSNIRYQESCTKEIINQNQKNIAWPSNFYPYNVHQEQSGCGSRTVHNMLPGHEKQPGDNLWVANQNQGIVSGYAAHNVQFHTPQEGVEKDNRKNQNGVHYNVHHHQSNVQNDSLQNLGNTNSGQKQNNWSADLRKPQNYDNTYDLRLEKPKDVSTNEKLNPHVWPNYNAKEIDRKPGEKHCSNFSNVPVTASESIPYNLYQSKNPNMTDSSHNFVNNKSKVSPDKTGNAPSMVEHNDFNIFLEAAKEVGQHSCEKPKSKVLGNPQVPRNAENASNIVNKSTKTVETPQIKPNHNLSKTGDSFQKEPIEKSQCYFSTTYTNAACNFNYRADSTKIPPTCSYMNLNRNYPNPMYTNSSNYGYNYSEATFNQNCYKSAIAKTDTKYYPINYDSYQDVSKYYENPNHYSADKKIANGTKGKATNNQSKTINWMTSPENKASDCFLPTFPAQSYSFSSCATTNEANETNESKRNTDIAALPEDKQFSWSPTKFPNFLDPTHNFATPSLPTLVGDLALGNPLTFTDQKTSYNCSKEGKRKSGACEGQAANFLSVSQLVDHSKTENVPAKTTARRNSGGRSKSASSSKKKSPKSDAGADKHQSKGGNNYNQNDMFCEEKSRSASKNISSNYSAEALIGNPVPEAPPKKTDNPASKSVGSSSFLTENIITYFPHVEENYPIPAQNVTLPHNNFQNPAYSTNSFIYAASTIASTYLPNSFEGNHPDLPATANSVRDNKNCSKSYRHSASKDDKQNCGANSRKTKKKQTAEQAGNLTNFDYSFLSVPGSANSPILPEDFHAHSSFLAPANAPYPGKPVLYQKQGNDFNPNAILPLPGLPRSSIQHPEVSPSINSAGTSFTNFNLSTIFPEINKGSTASVYQDNNMKETTNVGSLQVPFSVEPKYSFSS